MSMPRPEIVQSWRALRKRLGALFPQWACLQANLERAVDAIRDGEFPMAASVFPVPLGTPWDPVALTVRHADLRRWMQRHYPDQRPAFLFESIHDIHEHISPRQLTCPSKPSATPSCKNVIRCNARFREWRLTSKHWDWNSKALTR